jgi:hypothetical protein
VHRMPGVSRLRRAIVLALALAGVAAVPATGSAAATCKTPTDDGWGPTYVTSLTVTKASCATGKALVKAYYRCRVANGGADGTCRRRVLGFRCTEKRLGAIKTQFDAKVTCTKGSARVAQTYTQFT